MNARVRALFAAQEVPDREVTYPASVELLALAEKRVAWSYEVWDQLVRDLSHRDGERRGFAVELLARLAISDPENRMRRDFADLAAVLRDDVLATARQALQSIWRVGLAGPDRAALVLDALTTRFRECASEEHACLVRNDTVTSLGQLFRRTNDGAIDARVQELMRSEADREAQTKQRASWQAASM